MGSGATAKYALEYPVGTDAPNVPGDVATLAQMVDAIFVGFAPDNTIANRPAVGKSGRMFVESAASLGLPGTMWREDGATWRAMGSRIQPNATGDIGEIIRAVTGQAADLFRVEDPVGNPYVKVASVGATSITPGGGSTAAQALLAQAGPANQRAIVAKMASAASVNPFEVQDSTGALKAFIDTTGLANVAAVTASGTVTGTGGLTTSGTVTGRLARYTSAAVGDVVEVVKGFAGQTGDLTQWQNSVASVQAAVRYDGLLYVPSFSDFMFNPAATGSDARARIQPAASASMGLVVAGNASQSGDLTRWVNSAGSVLARVDSGGSFKNGFLVANGAAASPQFYFTNGNNPANIAVVVQTFAPGQTADLQQWQNSAGAAMSRIDNVGGAHFTGITELTGTSTDDLHLQFSQAGVDKAQIAVPGIAGHFVAGTPVGSMALRTASGSFWFSGDNGTTAPFRLLAGAPLSGGNGAVASIVAPAAAYVGQIIQGAASQTQDLSVWMNSSGTPMSRVSSDGTWYSNFLVLNSGSPLSNGVASSAFSAQAVVAAGTAVSVRGTSGQTGDLQQWINSVGTRQSAVTSNGSIRTYMDNGTTAAVNMAQGTAPDGVTSGTRLTVNTGTTAATGISIAGTSGQFGPLLYVAATSGGANIANITASGNVQGTGAYTTLSDSSVKMNVRELVHDPMDVVRRLRPVHFDYIGGPRDQVGFIANEVEPVLPSAVSPWDMLAGGIPDYEGRLGLQDSAITAYNTAAIQELDRRLTALERAA